ncbi:MAG: hypothetical protein H0X66_06110 [Verrucomicrobia bacterium]|nr:hypothetical protein [Verrucomicrobiota bacterium]
MLAWAALVSDIGISTLLSAAGHYASVIITIGDFQTALRFANDIGESIFKRNVCHGPG